MGETNGHGNGSEGPLLERLVGLIERLNDWMRRAEVKDDLYLERLALLQSSLDRADREHADILDRLSQIRGGVSEARDDIEAIREDTDPRLRITDPALDKPRDGSGKLVAFARLAEKVPTPWVLWLLKFAVSTAVGGLALRFWQWLSHGS